MKLYKNKTISVQLKLIITFCLLLGFSSISVMVYKNVSEVVLKRTLEEQQSKLDTLADTISSQFFIYLDNAKKLEATFRRAYLRDLIFENQEELFEGKRIQAVTLDGKSVINNFQVPDDFYRDTGAISTLFLKSGGDFIRVTTSLKKQDGSRAVGTMLGGKHPGYKRLSEGEVYYAKVALFGRDYLTYYAPIMGRKNEVLGLSFIGIPVGAATQNIFKNLSSIKWGDTGESFVVSNQNTDLGHYLYHSRWGNEMSVLDLKDASGVSVLNNSFWQSRGEVIYKEFVDGREQEKYLIFSDVPGWNWKLFGGTRISEITKDSKALLETIVIISLIGGVVTLVIMSLFLRQMTNPLITLSHYMTRLGNGEVSFSVGETDEQSKNEIDKLMYSMSSMAKKLDSLVGDIRLTSDDLCRQSTEVANDAGITLDKSNVQQDQIDLIVSAVEEIAATAASSAEQIEEVAVSVNRAKSDSGSGTRLVAQMKSEMAQMDEQLKLSIDAVRRVNRESENIQAVTDMIDSIAEKTNLLALNAAIEAARAGEQGHGFAIVAEEVRTLAAKTQTSVKDVKEIMDLLKESTEEAVSMISESESKSELVITHAGEVGNALESIVNQVEVIAEQSNAIATAADEQAVVTREISENVSKVSMLNRDNYKIASKTANRASDMHKLSEDLSEQVSYFS